MGSVGMAINILKNYGLQKLYMGFLPTWIREAVGLGCYFGTYEYLIRKFTHNGEVSLVGSLTCGGAAGISFWLFIYPVDYIKTLLQSDSLAKPVYKGSWDCYIQNKHKGVPVFFTGFGIMAVRSLVANAVGFSCFELGRKMVY